MFPKTKTLFYSPQTPLEADPVALQPLTDLMLHQEKGHTSGIANQFDQ